MSDTRGFETEHDFLDAVGKAVAKTLLDLRELDPVFQMLMARTLANALEHLWAGTAEYTTARRLGKKLRVLPKFKDGE